MLSIFCAPARYVQGRNATESIGREMSKLGLTGTAFVIAGKHANKQLNQVWDQSFSQHGIKYSVSQFAGECTLGEIQRLKVQASELNATVVIGAGGGKVLDTARAVAAELNLPVVNCPTLASSDAPCSALSVVYTPEGQFDRYLFYKRNPDLVLVDTAVIAKAPVRLLVAGMGDALATWFEARTVCQARRMNQVAGATTISARALAELCYKTLLEDGPNAVRAVSTGSVTPALERLVEANTLLSGLGFESGGLAVAHSVHNGLTVAAETHSYYHGEKVSFGLLTQLVLEGQPSSEIEEVMNFSLQVGLPITLADVGLPSLPSDLLLRISERTVAEGETAHNEPFKVSAEAVADAIVTADAIGTKFKEVFARNKQTLDQPALSGRR